MGNIEEYCFACLEQKDSMVCLDENEKATFKDLFNLEIEFDVAPKPMCNDCREQLDLSLKFYSQVKNNLEYLKDYRNKLESKHLMVEIKEEVLQESDNDYSDSDYEPLSSLMSGKRGTKQKLIKIPSHDIEVAIEEYKQQSKLNTNCRLCGFVGVNIRNLSLHMKFKHGKKKNYWCSKCNEFFDNISDHKQLHNNHLCCQFCSKTVSRNHYVDHLKAHAGFEYCCSICVKKFISQESLDSHFLTHNEEKPYRCSNCLKSFKTLNTLQDHLLLHGRYKCDKCDKHFEILELLKVHMCCPRKGNFDKNVEEDAGCGSEDFQLKIKQHIQNLENRKIEDMTCIFCQKSYKTAYKLQMHLKGHMGEYAFKCSNCDKGFSSKADWVNHERTHNKQKIFVCNICGKGLSSPATLRIHLKQHTGRPEQCELCQKRFCRKSELKLHLQKHRGERPFLCTDCGMSFAQRSHLTSHLTMHVDVRPFQCELCDKAFKKKELLKHHKKLHGEKKFKCSVCFYECHKNYRLQQHMKMHEDKPKKTNSKNNVCQLCNKAFGSGTMLKSHMSNTHSVVL